MSDNKVVPMPEKKEAIEKEEQSPYKITFSRPYRFEEAEYPGVDLSNLPNISSEDLFEATRIIHGEYINPKPEADPKFCCIIAGLACGKPETFFTGLPVKDLIKVRNAVQHFFLVED